MKKILSLCLAILMLLTALPIDASAVENKTYTQTELLTLACEVFPEYESEIINQENRSFANYRSSDSDEIIFSETRDISDNQSLTLLQRRSGDIIVVSREIDWANLYVNDSTSDISNVGVTGTADFQINTTSASGTFILSDVRFTIYYTGSDYFTSTGTVSGLGYSLGSTNVTNTSISYNITFNANYNEFLSFHLNFVNNKLNATIR